MVKHFTVLIKKKAAKQKDVEQALAIAIANFNTSDSDFQVVSNSKYNFLLD